MDGVPSARLILTDEPYNVKISGHVTAGLHREFLMASGEMTDDQLLVFNSAWMAAALLFLCDGGVFGTFICQALRDREARGQKGRLTVAAPSVACSPAWSPSCFTYAQTRTI